MESFAAPSLTDADVLQAIAGIRPCRRGGLRLETEVFELAHGAKTVVHNYGQGGCGVTLCFGCAERAADLVDESTGRASGPDRTPIAVLGGGVIGLTTALELATRGYRVRVYADRFANDTTSNAAGALWLPTGIEFPDDPAERAHLNNLLARSADRFRALDPDTWGVEILPIYEPETCPHHPRYFESGAIEHPHAIAELPVGGRPRVGRVYQTFFIHTPRFLRTLIARLEAVGVDLVERRFDSPDDVMSLDEPVLVNGLALGSRELFGDAAMYPARGVLVHVRPQKLGYIVHDGYRYLFPREDALILGGTFEPGVDDDTPPPNTVRLILEHHRRFFASP